jgi:hypothetical protein
MEQRRLRLGDILDDYCPRERRVTNHAVVAMIEADVKQTRCTTCDAEHAYKGGRAPRRRKAESTGALYKEVLAGITSDQDAEEAAGTMATSHEDDSLSRRTVEEEGGAYDEPAEEPIPEGAAPPRDPEPADEPQQEEPEAPAADEGPVHRPLIRAQLPRPEGMKVERSIPEFTIRQNGGRGGNFRREAGPRGAGRNNPHQRFGRGPQRGGGGNRPGRGRRSR